MKSWLIIATFLLVLGAACSESGQPTSRGTDAPLDGSADASVQVDPADQQRATDVIDLLAREDFAAVFGKFSRGMAEAVPLDKVGGVWQSAVAQNGKFGSHGQPVVSKSPAGNVLFDFPLSFERGVAHLQITFDDDDRITGMILRPGDPTGVWGR